MREGWRDDEKDAEERRLRDEGEAAEERRLEE